MKLISDEYCKQNRMMHERKKKGKKYGTTAGRYKAELKKWIDKYEITDVIDYGCGKATFEGSFPELKVFNYDPAIPKYNDLPSPKDAVVCMDVLEHIEPKYLDNVLKHLYELMKRVGYFSIACVPSSKFLPDGRNSHLIIEDETWWITILHKYFKILEKGTTLTGFYVIVQKK